MHKRWQSGFSTWYKKINSYRFLKSTKKTIQLYSIFLAAILKTAEIYVGKIGYGLWECRKTNLIEVEMSMFCF
jgi:hypothetical protein